MNPSPHEPERFRSPEYLAVLDPHTTSLKLTISSQHLKKMYGNGEAGYPHEVCGLLVGHIDAAGWDVQDVRPVANINEARAADRFQLDPAGYQSIDRELRGTGVEIIGVYHSHPDCPAKPSPTDLDSAWEGFAYPIISICDAKYADLRCWSVNAEHTAFQQININEITA